MTNSKPKPRAGTAGNVWRQIKTELDKAGVTFPINYKGIGGAYGVYTIIGEALSRQEQEVRAETTLELNKMFRDKLSRREQEVREGIISELYKIQKACREADGMIDGVTALHQAIEAVEGEK